VFLFYFVRLVDFWYYHYWRNKDDQNCGGTLQPQPLSDGGETDALETRYSITCVSVQNFVALGWTVWSHVGVQKISRALKPRPNWDVGVPDPYKYAPPPPVLYRAKFGHSRSNRTSVINEIGQKNLTHHAPPFRVTQGHWNLYTNLSATQYPWLLVSVP